MSIDAERKLTCKEEVLLYYYSKGKMHNEFPKHIDENDFKSNFHIKEELIESFNNLSRDKVNQIEQAAISDSEELEKFENEYAREPWNFEKPVIWGDREHTENFIIKLETSHRFEVYIDSEFKRNHFDIGLYYGRDGQYAGESNAGIEIKNDCKMEQTGNIYVEYQERMEDTGKWVNSGILKQDNTIVYVFGTMRDYLFVLKERLIYYYEALLNHEELEGMRFVNETAHHTSKGYIISRSVLENDSLSINQIILMLNNR